MSELQAKKCSRCKIVKPLVDFCKNRSNKDGLNHYCRECAGAVWSKWSKEHPEKVSEWQANYRKRNPEKQKEKHEKWYQKNRDYVLSCRQRDAEKIASYKAEYRQTNKDKVIAYKTMHKAMRLNATPSWANMAAISEIYAAAVKLTNETGEKYHVDHIVPLKSKFVCGLHCEANLQVLPALENLSKSNVHWPNMPEHFPAALAVYESISPP